MGQLNALIHKLNAKVVIISFFLLQFLALHTVFKMKLPHNKIEVGSFLLC